MKLKVYNSDFSACAEKDIPSFVTLEGDKGVVALKQYLVAFEANLRQGNACAKDRGEVSGTGKKPYRQKGTGMARQGSKRSPIWSGGGVVFGPKPRDYSQKINKQVKRLALMRALSDRANDGGLVMAEKLVSAEPKTKILNKALEKTFTSGSILFVDQVFDENFVLASGNISRVFVVDSDSLNAFDVIRYKNVVISESAMNAVIERLAGSKE